MKMKNENARRRPGARLPTGLPERIARTNAETENARIEAEKYAIEKDNERKRTLAEIQRDINAKEQEEETKRQNQKYERDLEAARIQENSRIAQSHEQAESERFASQQSTEKVRIQEEEESRRTEIQARRDVAISESENRVKEKAIAEISNMFSSYLKYTTESHKAEIELLYKNSEIQKEKFMRLIDANQSEKEKLMELSAQASSDTDKLNYLNRIDDCEATIKTLIEKDEEADKNLKAALAQISYRQRVETQKSNEKLISTDMLFLSQPDAEIGEAQ